MPELPLKPTWGIAVMPDHVHGEIVGMWQIWSEDDVDFLVEMENGWDSYPVSMVVDFIELTPAQIKRIEAVY